MLLHITLANDERFGIWEGCPNANGAACVAGRCEPVPRIDDSRLQIVAIRGGAVSDHPAAQLGWLVAGRIDVATMPERRPAVRQ